MSVRPLLQQREQKQQLASDWVSLFLWTTSASVLMLIPYVLMLIPDVLVLTKRS